MRKFGHYSWLLGTSAVLMFAFTNCSKGFETLATATTSNFASEGPPSDAGGIPIGATPTPTPTPTAAGMPKENDVVDSNLIVVDAAYKTMAAQLSSDAGTSYRYGPDANFYGTASNAGFPDFAKRPNQSLSPLTQELGFSNRSCSPNYWCGNWQIGGPLMKDPGDYSSSILNFSFIPDNAGTHPGAGSVQQLSIGHNAYSFEPEPSWTFYKSAADGGGATDPNISDYLKQGIPVQKPMALGKCYGRGGWCTNSLTAFASGAIVATGGNTSRNKVAVQLAPNKIPTAIAVTNSGEFALVTVWDTAAIKGQVAVIALAGMCEGCDPNNEATWGPNWGDWMRMYMGLPNLGNWGGMKIVGYIDLPQTLKAPTEISVTTGVSNEDYQSVTRMSDTDLNDASARARYYSGDLRKAIARAGMAVVISKSEKRAAFIDLRPLFAYYREQYFGQNQAQFQTLIASRGQAANQWPYTFTQVPAQAPIVSKVMDLSGVPTAVKMKLSLPARAFIATQEGKLRVYDLGNNYLNQTGTGGSPGEINELGVADIGRNPTSITYAREHGWNGVARAYPAGVDREMIVSARGDRKIQWVRFNENYTGGAIVRTLQDAKIADPIAVEDAANHGTESYVVSVADFSGKKIHNFMYGPLLWWTIRSNNCQPPNGCTLLNNAPFEYGGAFLVPGKPVHLGGANIN